MGLCSQQISVGIHDGPQKGHVLETPKPDDIGEVQKGAPLKCPRCESMNTKFCYFNNYSRAQPRHFCRACQRHWTVGGTLRNVPIGGGRKNKRQKTTHSNTTSLSVHPSPTFAASTLLVAELEEAIFPDILRRVLLHPQAVDSGEELFGNSLQNAMPPLVIGFGGISSGFDYTLESNPLMAGASLYSSPSSYSCGRPGEQSLVLPESCWDFWDGSADFNDAGLGDQLLPE